MGMIEIFIIFVVLVLIFLFFGMRGSKSATTSQISSAEIDWDAIWSDSVQDALNRNVKIEAIKAYRQLTGLGLKESKDAIEYALARPQEKGIKKGQQLDSLSDAGLPDLIAEGNLEEAINIYQKFAGVDKFTATEAVKQIEREIKLSDDRLYDSSSSPIDGGNKEQGSVI